MLLPFNTTRKLRTPKHEGHGRTITSWTERCGPELSVAQLRESTGGHGTAPITLHVRSCIGSFVHPWRAGSRSGKGRGERASQVSAISAARFEYVLNVKHEIDTWLSVCRDPHLDSTNV